MIESENLFSAHEKFHKFFSHSLHLPLWKGGRGWKTIKNNKLRLFAFEYCVNEPKNKYWGGRKKKKCKFYVRNQFYTSAQSRTTERKSWHERKKNISKINSLDTLLLLLLFVPLIIWWVCVCTLGAHKRAVRMSELFRVN